jgi:ankyrin repeat protein
MLDQRGETALEVALKLRQPSLARTLVEHHADLSAKDSRGLSLLHSAILKADSYAAEFIVEQLENNGSTRVKDFDQPSTTDGRMALHLLAAHATEDMLAVAGRLLKAGLDPNAQNHDGW